MSLGCCCLFGHTEKQDMKNMPPFRSVAGFFLLVASSNAFTTLSTASTKSTVMSSIASTISEAATDASPNFWTSSKLKQLSDPPSQELLDLLLAEPYRGGLEPADDVSKYAPNIIQGEIPRDLVGSLASNGPGRIRIGSECQYGHWFDGDGYVTLLSLDGRSNQASFQAKYVCTERYRKQQSMRESDRMASSGAWTLRGKGKWYENLAEIPTNPANTATMWVSSSSSPKPRLLALCEGGQPYELDPETLETIGEEGSFFDNTKTPDSFFSAHFSRTQNGDILNHGYKLKPGPGSKEINLVRLSKQGELLNQKSTVLPFDTFIHDSILSANHLVYVLPPWKIPEAAMLQFLIGRKAFAKLYMWDESDATYVRIHAQKDFSLQWEIKLPELMSTYHLVDAHEKVDDSDGSLLMKLRVSELDPLDRVRQESQFADQYRVGDDRLFTKLVEYTFRLDPSSVNGDLNSPATCKGDFVGRQDIAPGHAPCEFPTTNANFYAAEENGRLRYCWINALSSPEENWLDGLQKVDMQAGTFSKVVTFGAGSYCGAPTFLSKTDINGVNEDDGYLLATVYKSAEHRSDAVILDAASMEIMCVIALESHVPYQFHGEFQRGYVP